MKSIIVIYDDLLELDRTEVAYQGETQLKSIVKSLMADYPESEKAEVYNKITRDLVYAYRRDSKGNIAEIARYVPKRPVKRKTAAMTPDPKYPRRMTFWMNDAVYERLDNVRGHRASYVRKAVEEKLEREGDPLPPDPLAKEEGHPDRRYHRMFKHLPPNIRTYNAQTTYRSPLTITRTSDNNLWRVSYGEYTTQPGAPSTENKDLLSALEWLDMWIKKYGNKWIVGKVIEDEEK